jgi:hypothetical protein
LACLLAQTESSVYGERTYYCFFFFYFMLWAFIPPRYILKVMDYSKRHSLTDSTCPRDGKPWEEES